MAVSLREFKAPSHAAEAHAAPKAGFDPAAAPAIYAPMDTHKKYGDGTPVSPLQIKQRREIVKDWFGEKWRDGSIGTAYKAWFYWLLSVIGILVFYSINLWVCAVLAYLAGYFWSEMLLNYAWTVEWFKGKALISTK